jgi:FtsH ternary system-associated peptide
VRSRHEAVPTILVTFSSPRAALSFAAAVPGASPPGASPPGARGRVRCHREPDGPWWVLAAMDAAVGRELAAALGGTIQELTRPGIARLDGWPRVSAARLAVQCLVPAAPPATFPTAHVLTSGSVSPRVLRRSVDTGAQVSYRAVTHRELSGTDAVPGLHIRLTATAGELPARLITALGSLPATHVFRSCDPAERLLLDVRWRFPVPSAMVVNGVPADEVWLAGGPGFGTRVLCTVGPEQDAADLLVPDPPVIPAAPAEQVPNRFAPIRLRVVLDHRAPLRRDAILLEDAELGLLRDHLRYRCLAEDGLLLLGAGRHLLVEPGGLAETIPFGLKMWKPGPAAVFIEEGCDLFPPVPPRARRHVFGLDSGHVVALWQAGAMAFNPAAGIPLWTQWLTTPAEVEHGLSAAALELLDRLAAVGPAVPAAEPAAEPTDPEPGEAARLELQGRYGEAARLLENAGQWLQAAIVWREAAAAEAESPPETPSVPS